jgi:hypothetical protein
MISVCSVGHCNVLPHMHWLCCSPSLAPKAAVLCSEQANCGVTAPVAVGAGLALALQVCWTCNEDAMHGPGRYNLLPYVNLPCTGCVRVHQCTEGSCRVQ